MKRFLNYSILIIFGLFSLNTIIPIGDYCRGLIEGLSFIFFGGLLLITFLFLTVINIIAIKKRKIRFDYIPLLIIMIFGIFSYYIIKSDEPKFWTKKIMTGSIDIDHSIRNATLIFYKNNTFAARLNNIDYSCTYQGNYELTNNILRLDRNDLPELSKNIFTTTYIVNYNLKTLTPLNNNFKTLILKR